MLRRPSRRRHGDADRCMPKSGSREPEGQPAEQQSPKRQAEEPTRRGQLRSGAGRKAEAVNPKVNPARATPKRKAAEPTRRGQLRSGAGRKAEAVNPKANRSAAISETEGGSTNSPRATPKRCVPKSGSGEPEGQPAERQLRSGACRKAEAVSPKANPPSGNSEAEGRRTNPPSCNHEAARAEKRKR